MAAKKRKTPQQGVRIQSGGSTRIDGDVVGRDQDKRTSTTTVTGSTGVVTGERGHVSLAVGTPAPAAAESFAQWQDQIEARIEANEQLSAANKQELKELAAKIREEGEKEKTDPSYLENLINMIGVMSRDIFEVAVTTLANPLAGIGLVCKKIGDKAAVGSQPKPN